MNDVEIRVTGRDTTGGMFSAVMARARALGEEVGSRLSQRLRAAGDAGAEGFGRAENQARGFGAVLGGVGRGVAQLVGAGVEMVVGFLRTASTKAAEMAMSIGTSMATAATSGASMTAATGGLNLLIGVALAAVAAFAALAVGVLALAPVLLVAGGAMGALTTAIAGGIATFAVFKLGLHGVNDAIGEIAEKGKITDETLAKLSTNGRLFVQEFAAIQKPLGELRRFIQDKLLDGMNVAFRDLTTKWLPASRTILGGLATDLNGFGKRVAEALGKPEFIANMTKASAGFGNMIDRIGMSMGGLIDAFGRLAGGSVPFLERIGELVSGLVDKFSAWIKTADESGAMTSFMQDAAQMLQDLWDIGGLVFGLVGDIVEILFPSSQRAADTFLGGVKIMLSELKKWLGDPENQEKIREWLDSLQDFAEKMITEVIPAVIGVVNTISGWIDKLEGWGESIDNWESSVAGAFRRVGSSAQDARNWVINAWNGAISWLSGVPGRVNGALSGMWGGVVSGFRSAINSVIGKWNSLSFSIGGGSFMGQQIPSVSFGSRQIPYMAHGGIHGGLAMVGERGRELVELPQGSRVIPNGTTEQMLAAGGQGTVINLTVNAGLGTDGPSLGRQLVGYILQHEIDNGTRWRTG